jgi:hypothetical protein
MLVIAAIVFVVLDFVKKGQATRTGQAWTQAFDGTEEGQWLKLSELEPLIVGSPSRSERPAPEDSGVDAHKIVTYTWSGTVRSYRIDLYVVEGEAGAASVSKIKVMAAVEVESSAPRMS